jgi:hypothetical protein
MTQETDEEQRTHLLTMLSVSSGMAGVCATAIGLIGIAKRMSTTEMIVDEFFAVGAVMFLLVTGLSFFCLRNRWARRKKSFVTAIDVFFFLGLSTVVIASLFLTWMVI